MFLKFVNSSEGEKYQVIQVTMYQCNVQEVTGWKLGHVAWNASIWNLQKRASSQLYSLETIYCQKQ